MKSSLVELEIKNDNTKKIKIKNILIQFYIFKIIKMK